MAEPDDGVCVIIVNYNGGAFIGECLNALSRQTRRPERIIVVDNGSSDGSAETVEADHPEVELLSLGANLGFAEANNIGVRRAQGVRWIALLNPDAFPAPEWLQALMEAAASHEDHRFFGSLLLDAQRPGILDGDGDLYHVSGAAWRRGHGAAASRAAFQDREIFAPCAAAALYERAALLSIGGFDRRFFCYLEDVDLGFRLRLAGHRALQVAGARVLHVGSGIVGDMSDFSLYHVQRNLVWTFVKNMPIRLLLRFLPQHLALNFAGVIALARRGKSTVALRAKWHALRELPAVWRERKRIQASRRAADADLLRIMEKGLLTPYRREKGWMD